MTPSEANELLIRVDQSLKYIVQTQDELKERICHVEEVGEKTLNQTTKTNGRVTALEKENDYRIAEIEQLHKDLTPVKEQTTSFIHTIKGGWKATIGTIAVVWIIIEKIIEYII